MEVNNFDKMEFVLRADGTIAKLVFYNGDTTKMVCGNQQNRTLRRNVVKKRMLLSTTSHCMLYVFAAKKFDWCGFIARRRPHKGIIPVSVASCEPTAETHKPKNDLLVTKNPSTENQSIRKKPSGKRIKIRSNSR